MNNMVSVIRGTKQNLIASWTFTSPLKLFYSKLSHSHRHMSEMAGGNFIKYGTTLFKFGISPNFLQMSSWTRR